jgi:hypothetical protein
MADVVYSNVRELSKQLRAIEPALQKAMVKDIKTEIKPLATMVKAALPSVSPLSGANTSGRLGFGVGKPATSVSIRYRTGGSNRSAITSLASVKVNNALTSVMDYAGKGGGTTRSGVTRPYAYKGGTRTHRNNGQGQAMIDRLNSIRRPSRFAWPAAERALPMVQAKVQSVLESAAAQISRSFQ